MPTLADFILLISATAYLTWVVNNVEGPFGWFAKLRSFSPPPAPPHGNREGSSGLKGWRRILWPLKVTLSTSGEMAQCSWCTSFWAGLIVLALFLYIQPLLWVLAVAGFVNGWRTLYQHVALPRENKIRMDTAEYLKKNYGTNYATKYLELGDVQKAFTAANAEDV